MATNATFPNAMAVTVAFNLCWTEKSKNQSEDVDLMAFAYDQRGQFLSRVGFDLPNAMNAIMHSGDQKDGKGQPIDETIMLNYAMMPPNVHYIMLVVLVNNDKQLNQDLFSELRLFTAPFVHEQNLLTSNTSGPLDAWSSGSNKVFVPCVCVRTTQTNNFVLHNPQRLPIWTAPTAGMPYVWPILESILDSMIPPQIRLRTNPLALNLADKVFLPPPPYSVGPNGTLGTPFSQKEPTSSFVGLGWNVSKKGRVDLDAHCIIVKQHLEGKNEGKHTREHIYYANKTDTSGGIVHLGDNLTGKGDGDDERIMINLQKLGPEVQKLLFCVKIFTEGVTFSKVDGEFVRVVIDNKVVARFDLDNIPKSSKSKSVEKAQAALFCVIEKVPMGRSFGWQFKAVLEPVSASDMGHDAVKVAKHL